MLLLMLMGRNDIRPSGSDEAQLASFPLVKLVKLVKPQS